MMFAIAFLNSGRLWLLLVVAALVVGYVVAQARRRRYTVRLASAELFESVVPKRPGWWRHIPPALLAIGLASSVVAFARPVRVESVAQNQSTVMIAIDTSLSMMSDDVDPTRLDAAKKAATEFVNDLPSNLNVGLVSFDGVATVRVSPTLDHGDVTRAIDRLELGPSTAIGDAIIASVDALQALPVADPKNPVPSAIVLLSDGDTTKGHTAEEGAQAAIDAKVPVSTISFGTADGEITYDDPDIPGNDLETVPVPVKSEELAKIAEATGGTAFTADSLDKLKDVYKDIGDSFASEETLIEIGDRFSLISFLMVGLAAGLSLIWFRRLV